MEKKLYKSATDKKLAGVCGGVAKYFEIDSTIVRILWFVITWFYGIGLIAYIACALILPDDPTVVIVRTQPAEPQPPAEPVVVEDVKPVEFEVKEEVSE